MGSFRVLPGASGCFRDGVSVFSRLASSKAHGLEPSPSGHQSGSWRPRLPCRRRPDQQMFIAVFDGQGHYGDKVSEFCAHPPCFRQSTPTPWSTRTRTMQF
eukprot:4878157-Prymnesium_polylepis.1